MGLAIVNQNPVNAFDFATHNTCQIGRFAMNLGNWGGVPHYLSAQEAAEQLGVNRRTLYVYVSRRLVRSIGTHNNKRYLESDISKLLSRTKSARRPKAAARDVLDWGLPVLESAITLIDKGHIYYRGNDATWLARHDTIEGVAGILWGSETFPPYKKTAAHPLGQYKMTSRSGAMGRICELLGAGAGVQSSDDPAALRLEAAHLLRWLYAAAAGCSASNKPLDQVLASGFGRLQDAGVIRRAAILCADHELSPSAFSVRCAASTGAPLAAAMLAGLGTFYGSAQGGAVEEVEEFIDQCDAAGSAKAAVAQRLRSRQPLPGFGHVLHPDGDSRGSTLLEGFAQTPEMQALALAVFDSVGLKPNIVFGLVALRRALDLPRESALTIYVCGRAIGWAAHAIEQRLSKELIRPRAHYVGPQPTSPSRPRQGMTISGQ